MSLISSAASDLRIVCAGVLFNTLCNGGTLVLADPHTLETAAKICHVLPLTPSILATLDSKDRCDMEKSIFLGGESPSPSLIEAWSSPRRRLYNSYGPTETTCTALMGKLIPGKPITLGHPISYSTIILLDENGHESLEGEICIAGLGLALGYFRDPDRTAKSFITWNGMRVYKTGDYGKVTNFGMQFCGRKDSVVKNRGFLINLEGDVEPALMSFDKVNRASAFMSQGRLVAFVSPSQAKEGLREYLERTTSSFLIPDTIYPLDDFPTTSNGKIDHRSLVKIHEEEQDTDSNNLETGLSALEAVRRGISSVLRLQQSQVQGACSFRQLGGHSLAAVMLASALRKMGFEIGVADILLLDEVDTLAKSVKIVPDATSRSFQTTQVSLDQLKEEIAMTRPLGNETVVPMTDMQRRMVSASFDNPGLSFIKTSFTFEHPGQADLLSILYVAWERIHQRHEILHTSFFLTASSGAQIISPDPSFAWSQKFLTEAEWESACESEELLEVNQFPDFEAENQKSLSSVTVLTVKDSRTRFIWTIHHSLVDGWSMATLMDDFAACIDGQELPSAPQFAQVSQSISQLELESSDKAVRFWRDYLDVSIPVQRLKIPPPSNINDYTQGDVSQRLSISTKALEAAANNRLAVTPATILYAAWGLLLSRYCDAENIILGAVLSGRSLPIPGVENVIGPMINTLPLKVNADQSQTVRGFTQSVFKALCGILDFQWSPLSLIQEASGCKPSELFETLFALQYDFPQMPWKSKQISAPRDIRYTETTQLPLTVLLDSCEGILEVRCIYRKSYFGDQVIQRMMRQFDNILRALVEAAPSSGLDLVLSRPLDSSTIENFTSDPTQLIEKFEGVENLAQAINNMIREHPDICAVEGLTRSLTYEELGTLSDRLAFHLSRHTKPRDVICVVSDGSLSWVLALVAVIKAGAIYCPIDQKLPIERKKYMIANCQASLVLYTNAEQDLVACDVLSFNMESITGLGGAQEEDNFPVTSGARGDDIACLIYTSGSTGLPKGMLEL